MTFQELKGQLIVLFVTIMIGFMAYSSQIGVLWSYLGGATLHTALILLPLNFFVIMIYINYALTCLTDPGAVPPNWIPQQQHHLEVKKSTHAPRFCKTCNNYKPPRTHHCSSCGKCVLKMDHHCPFVNNCIGFANYCHFIRFLTYIEISSIYLLILLSCRLAQAIKSSTSLFISDWVLLGLNLLLCIIVIIGVAILSGYHIYCITTNTTTIEGWEKGRSLTLKSMGTVHDVMYPYDMGVMNNIKFVLGRQPLLWFWPRQMEGSGLSFPINITHLHTKGNTVTTSGINSKRSTLMMTEDEEDDKRSSIYSTWTTHTDMTHYQQQDTLTLNDITELSATHQPLHTLRSKLSTTTLNTPNTPGSILTFASAASTLIDSKSNHPYSHKTDL
ncbi:DHHC palmitoyltransferase-domain-containing protein [Halteromyces radiatus]|uniref:DHHC palmitoyltransferase-domain-containing protein n=1 Tax=Halteromyces radiatus TaxID=101107 RepID=UPI00221EA605|nr:DHHC palmitoyltransferase-domain-containing protein [Halteromyces radiatus]KAI8097732.1 DHHC palmitoyltransferase-domain-containing protein [Halteromyces radiatus]